MSRTSIRFRPVAYLIAFGVISIFMMGCQDEQHSPQAAHTPALNTDASSRAESITRIAFSDPAHGLLVDDIDGDGRLDLALTSHNMSYTQVFRQTEARRFTAGPRVDAVGFHPGNLMRLPSPENRRLYLMSAEGVNRLRVFESNSTGDLNMISETIVTAPRTASIFNWSNWGMGVAAGPFASSEIYLINHYDPISGEYQGGARLPFSPGVAYAHNIAVADLDQDGSDEILFTNSISNVVSLIRAPAPDATPSIEQLWQFKPGGRAEVVISADIDQDGDIDLLIPDSTDKRVLDRTDINVLINDGQAQFQALTIEFPTRPRSEGGLPGLRAIDFKTKQDGHGYLLAVGYESLALIRIPSGWSGAQPDMHRVHFGRAQAVTAAVLRDIDQDGALDIVMTRADGSNAALILYGPLWETLGPLASEEASLDW